MTLDSALLRYLADGVLPGEEHEVARVLKAAQYITMDGNGGLWMVAVEYGWSRCIPPIWQWGNYVRLAMANLVYPCGEKLYEHLR